VTTDTDDYIDRSEQSEKDYMFATPETLDKRRLDLIQHWVENDLLATALEDTIMEIRKAIAYIGNDVAVKMLDYSQIDVPNARSSSVDNLDEPLFVGKYFRWSRAVIRRLGYKNFTSVINLIRDGRRCSLNLLEEALQFYDC
jgi:hypothetical protein